MDYFEVGFSKMASDDDDSAKKLRALGLSAIGGGVAGRAYGKHLNYKDDLDYANDLLSADKNIYKRLRKQYVSELKSGLNKSNNPFRGETVRGLHSVRSTIGDETRAIRSHLKNMKINKAIGIAGLLTGLYGVKKTYDYGQEKKAYLTEKLAGLYNPKNEDEARRARNTHLKSLLAVPILAHAYAGAKYLANQGDSERAEFERQKAKHYAASATAYMFPLVVGPVAAGLNVIEAYINQKKLINAREQQKLNK